MISQYLIVLAKLQRIAHIRMLKDHLMKKPDIPGIASSFPEISWDLSRPNQGKVWNRLWFRLQVLHGWKLKILMNLNWWVLLICCHSNTSFSIPISSTGVVRISLVIWTQIIRYHTLWFLNSDLSCLPLRVLACLVEKCVCSVDWSRHFVPCLRLWAPVQWYSNRNPYLYPLPWRTRFWVLLCVCGLIRRYSAVALAGFLWSGLLQQLLRPVSRHDPNASHDRLCVCLELNPVWESPTVYQSCESCESCTQSLTASSYATSTSRLS